MDVWIRIVLAASRDLLLGFVMNVCVFYIYKYKIWDDLEKKNRKVKEEDYDIFYTSVYTSSIKDVSIIRVKRVEREISSRKEKKNHGS